MTEILVHVTCAHFGRAPDHAPLEALRQHCIDRLHTGPAPDRRCSELTAIAPGICFKMRGAPQESGGVTKCRDVTDRYTLFTSESENPLAK